MPKGKIIGNIEVHPFFTQHVIIHKLQNWECCLRRSHCSFCPAVPAYRQQRDIKIIDEAEWSLVTSLLQLPHPKIRSSTLYLDSKVPTKAFLPVDSCQIIIVVRPWGSGIFICHLPVFKFSLPVLKHTIFSLSNDFFKN